MKSITFFLLFWTLTGFSQTATFEKDSLWLVWENTSNPDSVRLDALDDLCWEYYLFTQPDSAFYFAQLGYDYAKSKGLKRQVAAALSTQGMSFSVRGEYLVALDYFEKCLQISEEINNQASVAGVLNKMGNIYNLIGNTPKALSFYQRNLTILESLDKTQSTSNTLNNIGSIYYHEKEYDKALEYYEKSVSIDEEYGFEDGIAGGMNNIANVYSDMKDFQKALEYYQRSYNAFEKSNNKQRMVSVLVNIGIVYQDLEKFEESEIQLNKGLALAQEIEYKGGETAAFNNIGLTYIEMNKLSEAIENCEKALVLANEIGSLIKQRAACSCLYVAHKANEDNAKALSYFEQMSVLNDSLFNEENTREITQLGMQYGFDKKEAAAQAEQDIKDAQAAEELNRQKLMRNWFIGGFIIVLLFAVVFLAQRNRIKKERQRSENLLLNILPKKVAEELKEKGSSDAQLIDQVTVLFTDFKGFTALSEKLSPKELVKDLHMCFSAFDEICGKYGIEKIKTIGDAYMAAGGLPTPNDTHPEDVVKAALEMAVVVEAGKQHKISQGLPFFEVRIGVHTGPVVAGIVGIKKFQYDIWGDTVNTASRMESSGEAGKVNVSESTYELIKDNAQFKFEGRGQIIAKGKGKLNMWFVE